ncbi:MAG TPA: hypothetical protein VFV01_16875 [Spirillospora sp.]|nr:hypothetical protein [Spirillospora sp.]
MAVDEDFILAMSEGISSVAPVNTAAPTGMDAATTPWEDLGAMSTDGLTNNNDETRTTFKRWGSIAVFKTVITDKATTFEVTFLESNPVVLGVYHRMGSTPTPDSTSHIISVVDDTTGTRDPRAFLFDVLDGTNHVRYYCPNAEVTATKAIEHKMDGLTSYGVTITAYPDENGVAIARSYLLDAIVAGG